MELSCIHCEKLQPIIVQPSGPHLKAVCSKCGRYIKHLNKPERDKLEIEEDQKHGNDRWDSS